MNESTEMKAHQEIAVTMPNDAKAIFCNATQVTVSDDSVIIQFAYVRPNTTGGQLISEIALSPKHAIDFSRALNSTIKTHFTRHIDQAG